MGFNMSNRDKCDWCGKTYDTSMKLFSSYCSKKCKSEASGTTGETPTRGTSSRRTSSRRTSSNESSVAEEVGGGCITVIFIIIALIVIAIVLLIVGVVFSNLTGIGL